MHSQRILTAAVLGPFLFMALWWGGKSIFALVLVAVAGLCLREYYEMTFPRQAAAQVLGIAAGLLPVGFALLWQDPGRLLFAVYVIFLGSALFFVISFGRWSHALSHWAVFLLGALYLGLSLAHLGLLRGLPMGREWLVFLIVVIFMGDAGAYYVGSFIGRRKLCPTVSKGKTVEGAAGGLMVNALTAFFLWFYLFPHADPRVLVPMGVTMGVIGQLGDLAESVIKRSVGLKDSGGLLPGHGGIFDRIDALLLAAPAMYWAASAARIEKLVIS